MASQRSDASSEESQSPFRRKPGYHGPRSQGVADRNKPLATLPRKNEDDEFPFRSTKIQREDERLARAVARGKSVLWPVTFLSTLGIGVGCSAGGIVKTKEWTNRFYFEIFIATLVGWLVLLVIQLVIMNELYTEARHGKVVVALAMAFGGWVSGYFLAVLAVVLVWRPPAEGNGAGALLIVQALLGVGSSLVGFWFYFKGYVRPLRKAPLRSWEKGQTRRPHEKAAAHAAEAIKRRFSDKSANSRTRRNSQTVSGSEWPAYKSADTGSSTSTDNYDPPPHHTGPTGRPSSAAQSSESDSTDTDGSEPPPSRPSRYARNAQTGPVPTFLYPPLPTRPSGAPRPPPGAAPPGSGIPVQVKSAVRRKPVPPHTPAAPLHQTARQTLQQTGQENPRRIPPKEFRSVSPYPPSRLSRPVGSPASAFRSPEATAPQRTSTAASQTQQPNPDALPHMPLFRPSSKS